ncbi:3-beta-hydroxysteroid sulfotransferase [Fukomys damarensis]|uniref:Sulfotransferase n=1 Tax=Fukomys damarensis TaxID=885580 RepID=A0A091D5F0_FUKDA|nr:3-beta-hydroxysteroid sulfotransferase [Fukomys damarensis]
MQDPGGFLGELGWSPRAQGSWNPTQGTKELIVMMDDYVWFEGIAFPTVDTKPENLREIQENFVVNDEDVINLTYPKSVVYGSWFEHIRGWLSRRQCENFLVVSYEELTKDTRSVVEKICQFLGKKLTPEEIDLVLKYSSFHFMKENQMSNFSTLPSEYLKSGFLLQRKGVTGDWKNHFTVAQAEEFDEVYQQNMAGFPPKLFPWE